MATVKYVGMYEGVDVVDTETDTTFTVMNGESVEVTDELAQKLMVQEGNWESDVAPAPQTEEPAPEPEVTE